MSAAETWAVMSKTGATKKAWRLLCKNARKLHAKIYSSYEAVSEYRHSKCTANGVESLGKDEVRVPLQQALNHQIKRLFSEDYDDPEMKRQAVELHSLGYLIEYFFKYGSDESSGHSQ